MKAQAGAEKLPELQEYLESFQVNFRCLEGPESFGTLPGRPAHGAAPEEL